MELEPAPLFAGTLMHPKDCRLTRRCLPNLACIACGRYLSGNCSVATRQNGKHAQRCSQRINTAGPSQIGGQKIFDFSIEVVVDPRHAQQVFLGKKPLRSASGIALLARLYDPLAVN